MGKMIKKIKRYWCRPELSTLTQAAQTNLKVGQTSVKFSESLVARLNISNEAEKHHANDKIIRTL